MNLETFSELLSVDNLNIDNEIILYDAVRKYKRTWKHLYREHHIRQLLQKIRFLSLTPQQFMRNIFSTDGMLTYDECYALFQNIVSINSHVPMPAGFSMSRERRQSNFLSNRRPDDFENIVDELQCGYPTRVQTAVEAVSVIMDRPFYIDPELIGGLLDAMVPALTVGNDQCKSEAIKAITSLSCRGSRQQLDALLDSAAMPPYCSLMAHPILDVEALYGLFMYMERTSRRTVDPVLRKLRTLGVEEMLRGFCSGSVPNRARVSDAILDYFNPLLR